MDSNLMSCPTCGHSVNSIAGACNYCGAVVEEKGPPPQAENKAIGEKAQMAASPPPLPHQQTHQADEMPDKSRENVVAAPEQPEADASRQPADSPAKAETITLDTEVPVAAMATAKTSKPATEASAVSEDEWTSVEPEAVSQPVVDDQDVKTAPEGGPLNQNREDNTEVDRTEASEPETAPDVAAEPAVDEKPGAQEPDGEAFSASDTVIALDRHENQTDTVLDAPQPHPEPEVSDKSGDEAGESESPGEMKAEPVEKDATEQKSAGPSTAEKPTSLAKAVQEAETKTVENIAPKNNADLTADAPAGSTSEKLGDTIVLEVEDEVAQVAAVSPDKTAESAQSESKAAARKNDKPKADLAQAQTVKKQKAALAKAQSLKKQKMALAKATALKRKNAVQAKSQAIPEAPRKREPAAAAPPPKVDHAPQANSRMQALLEKYKGRVIGINYDNSADIRKAQLVEVNSEYFSVVVKEQNLKYSYPFKAIISFIEGKDGVDIGNSKQSKKFVAVIKVYPLLLF